MYSLPASVSILPRIVQSLCLLDSSANTAYENNLTRFYPPMIADGPSVLQKALTGGPSLLALTDQDEAWSKWKPSDSRSRKDAVVSNPVTVKQEETEPSKAKLSWSFSQLKAGQSIMDSPRQQSKPFVKPQVLTCDVMCFCLFLCPAAISSIIACAALACKMSMETNDNPSAQRGPLLDAHPLQIKELILRLEAEQRRREQARWEEAERVRSENPRPCFHLCAYCQRVCAHKSHSIGEHQQHMRDQWHRCDAHWYYSPQLAM